MRYKSFHDFSNRQRGSAPSSRVWWWSPYLRLNHRLDELHQHRHRHPSDDARPNYHNLPTWMSSTLYRLISMVRPRYSGIVVVVVDFLTDDDDGYRRYRLWLWSRPEVSPVGDAVAAAVDELPLVPPGSEWMSSLVPDCNASIMSLLSILINPPMSHRPRP